MRTPYYREQALEGIAREVITAYDPNLYYGVPRMIPIEDIIEAQGITLEYQCLRKTGCVLGETIFDDGGAIIYDYDIENTHPAIIEKETFEKVQALLQRKAARAKTRRRKSPLTMKIFCGNCGTPFLRRQGTNGATYWVCRKHNQSASSCPIGRIPEPEIYTAFLRMYRKLKCNADIILKPVMEQMNLLNAILQQNNPKMLAINLAIAETTEESHKISTLRANGLLDADASAVRMNAISAKLTQLRGQRRRLAENEVMDDVVDALRKVYQTVLDGPEEPDDLDDGLLEGIVEKITAESQSTLRFHLYGGLELTERLEMSAE